MQRGEPVAAQRGGALVGDDLGDGRIERERHLSLLTYKMLDFKFLAVENSYTGRLTSRHFDWKLRSMPEDPEDAVDKEIRIWAGQLPDLDLLTEGIVSRIWHLSKRLKRSSDEAFAEVGLDHGQWKVLSALRTAGPPFQRSAGALAKLLDLTSGAMTSRLDRMETAGLVRRLPDPDDRRGVKIEITDRGSELWEHAVEVMAAKEQLVAGALSDREKAQLNTLLKRLVLSFEAAESERAAGSRDAA
jgi:DNA-binding MarR family transcriptional regulator